MASQSQRNSTVCDAFRIPDEIWHEIILIACDSQHFSSSDRSSLPLPEPRQLKPLASIMANVCVRWNRLIVSAPLLWVTSLLVQDSFDASLLNTYTKWLGNSKNSDIDIFIVIESIEPHDIVNKFLQLVLPFSARWRTFYMSRSGHCASHILKLLPEDLHMRRLNSLSIDLYMPSSSVPFLFKPKTTVLRYLYLQSGILTTPNRQFEFNALDTLKLVRCHCSWEGLAAMLEQTPMLRSLRIERMYNPLEPASEIVHLNILSDMHFSGSLPDALRILRIIRSPLLHKLHLECSEEPCTWDPSFVGPSDFWPAACLKYLKIAIDVTDITRLAPLLVCPELEKLDMTVDDRFVLLRRFRVAESRLTKGGVFSNLKTFQLRSPNYSTFIFVLKHLEMPALTSLYLWRPKFSDLLQLLNYASMDSPINLPLLTHLEIDTLPGGQNEAALQYLSMPSLKRLSLWMHHYPYARSEEWSDFSIRYRDILNRVEHLSVSMAHDWKCLRPLYLQLHMLKSLELDFDPISPEFLRYFRFSKQVPAENSVLYHTRELIWLPPLSSLYIIIHQSDKLPYNQRRTIAALRCLVTKRVQAGQPRMTLKVVPSPESWPESDRAWMEARVELEGSFGLAEGESVWRKKEQNVFQICRRFLSRVKRSVRSVLNI